MYCDSQVKWPDVEWTWIFMVYVIKSITRLNGLENEKIHRFNNLTSLSSDI